MKWADKIRSMSDQELAEFFCAVGADLWGYCKAPPKEEDVHINEVWLGGEAYGG